MGMLPFWAPAPLYYCCLCYSPSSKVRMLRVPDSRRTSPSSVAVTRLHACDGVHVTPAALRAASRARGQLFELTVPVPDAAGDSDSDGDDDDLPRRLQPGDVLVFCDPGLADRYHASGKASAS